MNDEKVDGKFDQAKGKGKEIAGKVTGDKSTEYSGKGEQMKGKAKETYGDAKEKVKDTLDRD